MTDNGPGSPAPDAAPPRPPIPSGLAPPHPLPVREANTDLDDVLDAVATRSNVEFLVGATTPELVYVDPDDLSGITYPVLRPLLP